MGTDRNSVGRVYTHDPRKGMCTLHCTTLCIIDAVKDVFRRCQEAIP